MSVWDTNTAAQRGFAKESQVSRADVLQLNEEGAADVCDVLEEIGLSPKTGWYASILLYAAGGLITALLYMLRPDEIPVGVFVLSLFAITMAFISVFGAVYFTNANWATHMRLGAGCTIFFIGAFVAGPARIAFILLPLFVLVTPAFLYGWRFAIPYAFLVTIIAFTVILLTELPARFAHAWIAIGAIWMIVASFMVAENTTRKLARQNRRLAYTDPLTGIANTRRLRERLIEALHTPEGDGEQFALFAIDLDNFKLVNDNFDHTMGDRVLRAVAEELTRELEPGDLVARRGGDEFSVLASDPAQRDLDEYARRLAGAISHARMRTCPQVTPSGSIAYVLSRPADTMAKVLQRADDALHDVKRAFHADHGDREQAEIRMIAAVESPRAERRGSVSSVAAAIERAYAPRERSRIEEFELGTERFLNWAKGLNPYWSISAVALVVPGCSILFLTLIGSLEQLPMHVGLLCGAGYLCLSACGLWASAHDWPVRVLHVGFIGASAITTWLVWAAGDTGEALLDIYPVLVLYAFYFLTPREAFPYLIVLMALFTWFGLTQDYLYGGLRAGITDTVVVVMAILVTKVRHVTLRFVKLHEQLSEIDALTGLANVRALETRVDDVVRAAARKPEPPVIVTIDLDTFKQVNDRYNHTVGDQTLEAVARAISEAVRSEDLVARRGGDEFFIVFEQATEAHVAAVIKRLHKAIRHNRRRICPDLLPTASIGTVVWRRGETGTEFLARADRAMHDEKLETRSRGYERATA